MSEEKECEPDMMRPRNCATHDLLPLYPDNVCVRGRYTPPLVANPMGLYDAKQLLRALVAFMAEDDVGDCPTQNDIGEWVLTNIEEIREATK